MVPVSDKFADHILDLGKHIWCVNPDGKMALTEFIIHYLRDEWSARPFMGHAMRGGLLLRTTYLKFDTAESEIAFKLRFS